MSLKEQFDAAVIASKSLPEQPDNLTLLKLYGLFFSTRRKGTSRHAAGVLRNGGPGQVGRMV